MLYLLGDTEVVVFKVGNKESRVSTIVIRGATDNYMDDIERAVDDGVNVFKGVCKDGRLTAGGGSTEIELARQVSAWGETHAGLEQYSINKFAEALEVVPRVLAENSGVKPKEVIAKLYAAHSEGKTNMGFDIEGDR
jgi:T-complex protein 1 subunit theta